jgi:signal transduction histidine kinase
MSVQGWIVRLPDFLRTSTFRLAASFAVIFAVSAAILFAFIYWQTAVHETNRIDRFLTDDSLIIGKESPAQVYEAVSLRITGDLHRISYAALFDHSGRRLAGNLQAIPAGLPLDGRAHAVPFFLAADERNDTESARAVARLLPSGDILVIGRNVEALRTLGDSVVRALELGVIPAMLLAIVAGAIVSWRAQQRVKLVHRSAERILFGDLTERLPTRGTDDDFDRLASSVNLMLDEISRLLDNVKEAGNNIAHDLRTPLARLRARLERGREAAGSHADLRHSVDSAIADLDEAIGLVTTLLRIGEIEAGRRREGMADFDLGALVEEVGQIYQPLAEEKAIAFDSRTEAGLTIHADRGLLLEAIANLVQNAIKFTPAGGRVTVTAAGSSPGPTVRVADDGPGIPVEERERVFDRFYRLDKSRRIEGTGLGLSLVTAIAKFHRFRVELSDAAPGCVFVIVCRAEATMSEHSAGAAAD